MSADVLREAAALMRQRAEAATPGPWTVVPGASTVWRFPDEGWPTVVVPGNGQQGRRVRQPDADHIASWHPVVALAVANWLEASARAYEALAGDPTSITYLTPSSVPTMTEALDVALAYLGRDA